MKKNIISKIAVASVVLGVSSVSFAAGPASIIKAVGSAGEKLVDSATVFTGGIVAGGNMKIENDVKVKDVVVVTGKDSEVKAQIGHVGGLKSKGNMEIKNSLEAGDIVIGAGEGSELEFKLGGIGN